MSILRRLSAAIARSGAVHSGCRHPGTRHPESRQWCPSFLFLLVPLLGFGATAIEATASKTNSPTEQQHHEQQSESLRRWLVTDENLPASQTLRQQFRAVAGDQTSAIATVEPVGDWHLTLYLDGPLMTPDGCQRAVRILTSKLEPLLALGSLEIVLATPEPRTILHPTQSSESVRRALEELSVNHVESGTLIWHRERYAGRQAPADRLADRPDDRSGDRSYRRSAEQFEADLRARQHERLGTWLDQHATTGPAALLYLGDGFDRRASDFYSPQRLDPFADRVAERAFDDLQKALGRSNRTLLALSLGTDRAVLGNRREPLEALLDATPGALIASARQLSDGISRLAGGAIVTTEEPFSTRSPPLLQAIDDPRKKLALLPFAARTSGSTSRTPPRDVAVSRSLEGAAEITTSPGFDPTPIVLLEPFVEFSNEESSTESKNTVRLEAVATPMAKTVEFFIDGAVVGTDSRSPFSISVDWQSESAGEIVAIARDTDGRPLGRDLRRWQRPRPTPDVRIVDARATEVGAQFALQSSRPVTEATSVEFFWGGQAVRNRRPLDEPLVELARPVADRPVAPQQQANDRQIAEGATGKESPHGESPNEESTRDRGVIQRDDIRVRVTWPNGTASEDAAFVGVESAERVEVHLLELWAETGHSRAVERASGSTSENAIPPWADIQVSNATTTPDIARQVQVRSQVPLELGIVVDTSGSMGFAIEPIKMALAGFFEQLPETDRAFLVDFDERPRLTRSQADSRPDLIAGLSSLRAQGSTDLYEAVQFALVPLEGSLDLGALIVLTDAGARHDRTLANDVLERAVRQAVPIYIVQLGRSDQYSSPSGAATTTLFDQHLAQRTSGQLFGNTAPERLRKTLGAIEQDLRGRILLSLEQPRPWTAEDLETLRVTADGKRLRTLLPRSPG